MGAAPFVLSEYGRVESDACGVPDEIYRAAITSAKNIVEAIISPNDNFSSTLAKMGRSLLEAKEKKIKPPCSELAYHLSEKLRLLHQYTHVGGATRKGRSVSPELALTVVQDLIEILRELGYVQK